MIKTHLKSICLAIGAAFILNGCSGSSGGGGDTPQPSPPAPTQTVAASSLTADEIKNLAFKASITNVSIPADGKPIVSFSITAQNSTDANASKAATQSAKNISGLKGYLARFTIATLVPGTNNGPDEWMNYLQRKNTNASNGWPTSDDSTGVLTDNGDGSYTYAFGTSIRQDVPHEKTTFHPVAVPYVPTQTHRIGFTIDGQPAGAVARITSLPFIHDFIPAGGTPSVLRDIASTVSCNECHTDLSTVLTKSGGTHSRGRGDVRFCIMCHTKQGGAMEANTASVNGVFPDPTKSVQVADNEVIGYFPVLMHKIHKGTALTKKNYNFWGIKLNDVKYPQTTLNCTKCHNTASALQADNYKNRPSRLGCGSCHDNINFATGVNLKDPAKSHAVQTSDVNCKVCHGPEQLFDSVVKHAAKVTVAQDAAKRTMSATINGVTVDANGGVTVNFTVKDGNAVVTDMTKFTKPSFGLTKLVKGADGAYKWVSYTANYRTKDANMAPVLQGRTENTGTLTANADGSFSYKFTLRNGDVEGDIRTITHAHNASATNLVPATYTPANWPQGLNVVEYEPTKTHRVAMTFQKVGTPNVDANNAWFDFVPAGGAVTETRNIVTMNNCASCHAGKKLHAAYQVEVCVICHTQDTKDSLTGQSVDLQTLVHKLHMGKYLPSVKAGGEYRINSETGGSHDYTKLGYPGLLKNCQMCHIEGAGAPANAANWRTIPTTNACITCHDSSNNIAHASYSGFVNNCISCHGSGKAVDAQAIHK